MRSAPAVDFPVGVGRFAKRLHGFLSAALLALMLLWAAQDAVPTRLKLLGLSLAVLVAGASLPGLRLHPQGRHTRLQWTGRMWWLHAGRPGHRHAVASTPVSVSVAWDLQDWMLLRCQEAGRPACWLWAERGADAAHWQDLRRALMQDGSARVAGTLRGRHG